MFAGKLNYFPFLFHTKIGFETSKVMKKISSHNNLKVIIPESLYIGSPGDSPLPTPLPPSSLRHCLKISILSFIFEK